MNPHHGPNRYAIYGRARFVDAKGNSTHDKMSSPVMTLPVLLRWWRHELHPHQPAVFYSKKLVKDIGLFNPDLYFSIDYDYWLRVIIKYQFHYVDEVFAYARSRSNCKTSNRVSDPIKSHWKVSSPYRRYLNLREWTYFWKDYLFDYKLPILFGDIAARLNLPPRLKALGRRILKMI